MAVSNVRSTIEGESLQRWARHTFSQREMRVCRICVAQLRDVYLRRYLELEVAPCMNRVLNINKPRRVEGEQRTAPSGRQGERRTSKLEETV
jgi:hypothetical protein